MLLSDSTHGRRERLERSRHSVFASFWMASRGRVKPLQPGTTSPHDGHFTVKVRLLETGEKFSVAGCSQRMKVGELKEKLELLAGIPKNLQTLSHLDDGDLSLDGNLVYDYAVWASKFMERKTLIYIVSATMVTSPADLALCQKTKRMLKKNNLCVNRPLMWHWEQQHLDMGDMPDSSTFKFNGIFPGAKLSLSVWPYDGLTDLIKFAAMGNLAKLIGVGVTPDSSFNTENSLRLNMKQKKEWLASRSGLALYIASHRGHLHVIRFLLQNGCNVQYKTRLGNTPLHAAAASDKSDCIDELLASGAQMQDTNAEGHTALDVARLCGHKKVERRLFFFQWEERAANLSIKTHLDPSELFAHQRHDSKLKTWLNGSHAKRYMANLIPFQEFQGSHLSAPPKKNPV